MMKDMGSKLVIAYQILAIHVLSQNFSNFDREAKNWSVLSIYFSSVKS